MENEKLHMRHVMLYEFRKGVSVGTAQKNISAVYLDRAPALRTVKKWFARFRNGDFSLEDQPRSGRPSVIDDAVVDALVKENPRITIEDIANRLKIDNSTVFRHLKKRKYASKLKNVLSVPGNRETKIRSPKKLFRATSRNTKLFKNGIDKLVNC